MASGINPLALLAMAARKQAGGDPQASGMDSNSGYAESVASLRGADPDMLLRELKAMKQKCAVLMVQNLERLPNVSGQLSKLVPQFDRVIKEVQQAQGVNSAVRNPIQMGAAQPPTMEGAPPAMSNGF